MKNAVLELMDVSYSYDEERQALNHINVRIYEKEHIAVLGSNGSGKSTFFLCLNGVLPLRNGSIFLRGEEIKSGKKDYQKLRKAIGYVFQDPDSQMVGSTVESEISFGLMNQNLSGDEIRRRITEITMDLGLSQYRKSSPHYLSGGEKKRVSIADILVMKPDVLLFDEPAASLDIKNTEAFEEILNRDDIREGTILISTHNIDFAWKWADRILVFHEGRLIGDDVPEAIFRDQSLLNRAGLKKPILHRMTERICKELGRRPPEQFPRSEEEFYEKFICMIQQMGI